MRFSQVENERLSEKIISDIKRMIEEGILRPGQRLPAEKILSQQMGVSRGTLREALKILESQGLIRRKPREGTLVHDDVEIEILFQNLVNNMRSATYFDLLKVREILEPEIVAIAIQESSDKELLLLKQAHLESNYSLHLCIAKASKNIILEDFIKTNLALIEDITKLTQIDPKRKSYTIREHDEVLQAILDRDIPRAKVAIRTHIQNARARLQEEIDNEEIEER